MDYLKEIYPSQLTAEKVNKSDHLANYLDLTLMIDSGGKLSTGLYDKWDNNNNEKDDPILNMTLKQVTHVRICQRLLLIAQQPKRTSMQLKGQIL